MPTAARLIAGLCLAATAWAVSFLIMPLMPDRTDFGWFAEINAALGFVAGWQVIGSRAGRGMVAAVGNGLTGGAVMVFWGLVLQGGYKMMSLATRGRYDGAFEAAVDVLNRMVEFAVLIAVPAVIAALVAGSILSGLIAEYASRRAS